MFYPLVADYKLAPWSVSGVALLALIQHEVSIAEGMPGEVKPVVTG